MVFEVDVERPQKREAPIERCEQIAARFTGDCMPGVYALRPGFPQEGLHLYLPSKGHPPSLCLDDRPWIEIKSRWTAVTFAERIRWWLAATARGDLHSETQPPEPLYLSDIAAIVPPDLLFGEWDEQRPLQLQSVSEDIQPQTIVLGEAHPEKGIVGRFLPIFLPGNPQIMQRLRAVPNYLDELHDELQNWGIDLIGALRQRISTLIGGDKNQLWYRPLILIRIPLLNLDGSPTGYADVKAFTTTGENNLLKIGEGLGLLHDHEGFDKGLGPVALRLPPDESMRGSDISVVVLSVHANFCREIAATGSGLPVDNRAVVLIGAGAIGSHVMEIMRRDGFGNWTLIDNDAVLPHNIQRHRVSASMVGKPKAQAMSTLANWLIGTTETTDICANILDKKPEAEVVLKNAQLIIDASASVPVSRALADEKERSARHASVFFNSVGGDVVLLGEDSGRSVKLDALEAQYYRAILDHPEFANHLSTEGEGYRYAGSCRSVSFKMPEHKVSLLSGAIAGELRRYVSGDEAAIVIWVGHPESGLRRISAPVHPIERHIRIGWEVVLDDGLVNTAKTLRKTALPAETGGIILGTIDVSRRQICAVKLVPAPKDSIGDHAGFKRGVTGLAAIVADAGRLTAGQVEYVGEWHSHPKGVPPEPSDTDVTQLIWLGSERRIESLPAIMMIVGDRLCTVSLVLPDTAISGF